MFVRHPFSFPFCPFNRSPVTPSPAPTNLLNLITDRGAGFAEEWFGLVGVGWAVFLGDFECLGALASIDPMEPVVVWPVALMVLLARCSSSRSSTQAKLRLGRQGRCWGLLGFWGIPPVEGARVSP